MAVEPSNLAQAGAVGIAILMLFGLYKISMVLAVAVSGEYSTSQEAKRAREDQAQVFMETIATESVAKMETIANNTARIAEESTEAQHNTVSVLSSICVSLEVERQDRRDDHAAILDKINPAAAATAAGDRES